MKLEIINIKGKSTGRSVSLSKDIFGIEPNEHAQYLDVKNHLSNKRQGNAKTKERAEIKGSTRKIKKQKGNRDFNSKVNKNVKKLARKSALSQKLSNNAISVIEKLDFKTPKTKSFVEILKSTGLDSKKTLFVLEGGNKNVYLSARNLKKYEIVSESEATTYSILNAQHIVIEENAVVNLESILK